MEKLAVGLMSGTSIDGIDAALVKITGYGLDTKAELIAFTTLPFTETVKNEIFQSMDQKDSNSALICSLNFKLGYLFADAVKMVCKKASISPLKLDFIASHGQTIYHLPESDHQYERSTLQIGEPAIIAYETGTVVISNFRSMDMAAGGEGAPLVPYTDYLLYRSETKGVALQNIGGIGNVTAIPKQAKLADLLAFDTGPGNMVIDELCRRLKGKSYDDGGKWASVGQVDKKIVEAWMQMDFFKQLPPKSTGRELFGAQFVDQLLQEHGHLPENDLIATATYFTALSIADAYQKFVLPTYSIEEMIVGGGGSENKTLLRFLQELLPNMTVMTQEDAGYSSEAKEAMAFALLGNETIHMQPANVPSATGAGQPVVLGSMTFPPHGIRTKA